MNQEGLESTIRDKSVGTFGVVVHASDAKTTSRAEPRPPRPPPYNVKVQLAISSDFQHWFGKEGEK